jgi:hypothetical protein
MISNPNKRVCTYCGVLEFTSKPGCLNMPYWMMSILQLEIGGNTIVQSYHLSKKATFIKIKPMQFAFVELANPKAVIETKIKNYVVLYTNQIIIIKHLDVEYSFTVIETRPFTVVTIIDADNTELEFAEADDYKQIMERRQKEKIEIEEKLQDEKIINEMHNFKGSPYIIGSNLGVKRKTPAKSKPIVKKPAYNPKDCKIMHGIVLY